MSADHNHLCRARAVVGLVLALGLAACTAAPPSAPPAPEPPADAPSVSVPLVPSEGSVGTTYRIVGVGDIMIGTNVPSPDLLPVEVRRGMDLATYIDPGLLEILRSADVTFGNLEGVLYDGDGPHKSCGDPSLCYVFRSPTFYAEILADAGFDMMSLANNHAGDFLDPGRRATVAALERAGIAAAGLDQPGLRTAIRRLSDGTRIGLAAFAPNRGTVSINNLDRADRLVGALADQADIVIVSFHGGAEGANHLHVPRRPEVAYGEARGDVYRFARTVIDAGADVVFGHGPHVPRAIDRYRGRFIAYSLGNFWTYKRINSRGIKGLAPVADLVVDQDGGVVSATIHSVRQRGAGVPHLDPERQAIELVARLTAQDVPEAGVTISPQGIVRWQAPYAALRP